MKDAGVYKKSMYRYFSSKDELGVAYIKMQTLAYIKNLRKNLAHCKSLETFWKLWMKGFRNMAQSENYYGCPFANFNNQTLGREVVFSDALSKAMDMWLQQLSTGVQKYFVTKGSFEKKKSLELSKRILVLMEGSIQMYMLSKDSSYLKILEMEGLELIARYKS